MQNFSKTQTWLNMEKSVKLSFHMQICCEYKNIPNYIFSYSFCKIIGDF